MSEPTAGRPVILVVEDDRLMCEMIAVLLRAEGYAPECARDGLEALEAIERHQPPADPISLILLDAHLPILEGEQLLTYLRKRGLKIPVVAISSDAEALATAASLGADATVEKPFTFEHLLGVVTHRVRQRAS